MVEKATAARDVAAGTSWAFREHRVPGTPALAGGCPGMAEVIAEEKTTTA